MNIIIWMNSILSIINILFKKIQVETASSAETKREQLKVPIAVLKAGETRSIQVHLEFPDSPVTFHLVEGNGPVYIHGQQVPGNYEIDDSTELSGEEEVSSMFDWVFLFQKLIVYYFWVHRKKIWMRRWKWNWRTQESLQTKMEKRSRTRLLGIDTNYCQKHSIKWLKIHANFLKSDCCCHFS